MNSIFSGDEECTTNTTLIAAGYSSCPEHSWIGLILLAFYMLISNVLLLNLLIAMFRYFDIRVARQDNESRSRAE